MGRQSFSLVSHLKRAVKKMNLILLGFKLNQWRLASIIGGAHSKRQRRLSFNDRLGLCCCIGDDKSDENYSHLRRVQSTITSHASDDGEDNIDRRADIFIANFRRQLRLERQVSLELRYCRGNSF